MAKETNKSTTILLLVIAGALLFLVGSFTGQITWGKFKPQPATGLTTTQKQDVLNMVNTQCNAISLTKEYMATFTNGTTGNFICQQQDNPRSICTLVLFNTPYNEENNYDGTLITTCSSKIYGGGSNQGLFMYSILCCKT